MIEEGFATRRVARILELEESDVKKVAQFGGLKIKKEIFHDDSQIDIILDLYERGVSAKNIGKKYSIDKRRVQKWAKATGILREKEEALRFVFFNEGAFDTIDNEINAYWLGFFYADVYNREVSGQITLSLQIKDRGHLVKLCNFLELSENEISYCKNKEGHEYYTVSIHSTHMSEVLAAKGCPQAKSFIIKYPDWIGPKLTVHFIRGMFDGDGSLVKRTNGEWKWNLATTKECGESIQKIIKNNLSIDVSLEDISNTGNNTYCLSTNGNEKVLKLAHWLYSGCDPQAMLDRKYERYIELIEKQKNRKSHNSPEKTAEFQKMEDNARAQIINMYKNGGMPKEIGDKFGIANNSVNRIIRKSGLKSDKLKRIDQAGTDKIINDYAAGSNCEEIAKDMEINSSTVSRILKRNGVQLRPNTRFAGKTHAK